MDTIINASEYARNLIEANLDPLITIDTEGKIMDANGAMAKITGKEREKLIGTDFKDYFTDPEKAREVYLEVFAKGFVANYPLTIIDGVLTEVLFNGTVFKNKQGKVLGAVVVARDVTEKKRLQKAFEIERQQFYDLFSEAPFSLGVLSGPDHRFEMANPMYLQLIGKKDIIGKSVRDVLPEVEVQGFIEILDSVYQTGKTFTANEMIVKLDVNNTGKPVNKYLNYIYQPHIGSDGKPNGILFFAVDVTEQVMSRKKIEESEIALQQSESRLKGIISSQTNYIIRTDLQGNYTYCNQKFIADFGWLHGDDNSELVGINSMVSIMPYHHEAVQHVVKKCFANPNQVFQIEIDKPAKNNGIKTTLWDFILLTDQEGRPEEIQCAGINITDRKKEADEKEKIIKDLIQHNKNLEQFSYIISHNLRAPVANILGFSELLKKENSDPDLLLDIMKGMSVAAKNMDIVIRDLNEILNISKVVSENKKEVHFQDLIEEISISIDIIIKKENVIIRSDFKSVDKMLSIRSYLYSIFYNLILNSIKFHKPGVRPIIEIRSIRTSNNLQLIFKDNGMGIDLEKHQHNLFGLYKRFHLLVEGKGMGMFMVKTQVETLGGKISVSSEVNKGSEFTIEFENIYS